VLTPATGSTDGHIYNYEYFGSMMTDQYCLLLNPKSSSCLEAFSFFLFSSFNDNISSAHWPYLGLAPSNKLNGPSYVNALNSTERMMNQSVSFQLGDWTEKYDYVGNDSITFGGNVESAFGGQLKRNIPLVDSSWMFNLNV
jgi:hypothetical protein